MSGGEVCAEVVVIANKRHEIVAVVAFDAIHNRQFSINGADVLVVGLTGFGTTPIVLLRASLIRDLGEAVECRLIAKALEHGESFLAIVADGRSGTGNRGRSDRGGTGGGAPCEERGERQEEDQDRGQSERLLLRLWGIGR